MSELLLRSAFDWAEELSWDHRADGDVPRDPRNSTGTALFQSFSLSYSDQNVDGVKKNIAPSIAHLFRVAPSFCITLPGTNMVTWMAFQ